MTRLRLLVSHAPWVAAICIALVCVASSRADDKSDLISRIEDKLEDAADALERLPEDSGDSAIERARSYVGEARRYAEDLGRIAGDDSSARRIAEDFDDIQDDFNDAAQQLRQMKAGMRRAEPVAARCAERDRELIRVARDHEARNDPEGLTELPKLAVSIQEETRRAIDELRAHDDRMDDWADDAHDFRGDGPWRELVSTVAQTARRTLELWRTSQEAAKRTCENLTRGVEHPDVKDALGKLGSSAGGRKAIIEQLERDARDLASTLSGVSEDSGMGSVDRAKSYLASIERGLDSLARTPTTDRQTKLILEKWPEGVRQMKEAIDDLEDLKLHQHDMDPLPEKCELKKREFADAIARNGADADGIDAIPKLAEATAEPVRAGLAKADERMREENDDLVRARNVSASDGPWNDIRNAEQRDADETHRTFKDNYEKTKGTCAEVVAGKDAAAVKIAVETLARTGATRDDLVKELEREIDAAAQKLNGAAGRSGDGDVAAAASLGADMEATLGRLRSTPGTAPRAKEGLERWPAYVAKYRTALASLLELKRAQYGADGLVAECKRMDDALLEYVAQFKDPAGIAAIEARATADQAAALTLLQSHRDRRGALDGWRAASVALELTEGKWSYLSGYVRAAGQGSFDHWAARLADGEKACGGLVKGPGHPTVETVLKMLRGRMPAMASHASKHDSTCKGVPAGRFCMVDGNCLDGTCTNHVCDQCPSRDDGRCHPPGTCSQDDYDSRRRDKEAACSKPFNSDAFKGNEKVDCDALGVLCNNAQACVRAREVVQQCFRGGDTRHLEELNTVRESAQKCEDLLHEKREKNLCR
jgi:hypothetical protein